MLLPAVGFAVVWERRVGQQNPLPLQFTLQQDGPRKQKRT